MMIIIVFIHLILFQFSFALTDELVEQISSNLISLSNDYVNDLSVNNRVMLPQGRNRANVPQSLTLLMNFRDDGTTSFQIMQGTQLVYLDNGLCVYGQLFDPTTGRCRDIYCQETNYKFNGTTCIPDKSQNSTNGYKRMSDIDLAMTLIIAPSSHYPKTSFSNHLNTQMNKTCTQNWKTLFHDALHTYLNIDRTRITKIKYDFTTEEDEASFPPVYDSKGKPKPSVRTENALMVHQPSIDDVLNETLSQNRSTMIKLSFSITDRDETSNDTLTGLHVVTLLLLGSEFHAVIDLCQNYSIKINAVTIVSDRNKTRDEFCSPPDVMMPTKNGEIRRRVRANGVIDYVVYVPELETTYESGDYTYLFIISTLAQKSPRDPVVAADNSSASSNSTSIRRLVSICNRQPQIVGRCPDSLVMRIALCEVTQYTNFSIRMKRSGRLYTNREYRFDHLRPDLYIVVCKIDSVNGTTGGKTLGFVERAPGILSTIAMFLSIIALAISLVTFGLFSSLRNLPGCNTINLIIALMIAETLFLCQSLIIMTSPSVCLLFALGIHFFYLASFFWMNVMAFDLWKTFHKGFSLYVYDIRERLPFYALYAWGSPMIIVLIGIILDAKNASLKPCYGRFFRGCYDVCFRTRNDTPLQGCWIESALMRFILFGCPVAIILLVNFVFYAVTVRSIRQGLKKVRVQLEHKFQRKKQVRPGEHDVKIYMRMAVLAGFGWTLGFILFILPDNQKGFKRFLVATVKYLFILLNATPGLFIFGVYVCNRRVLSLYRQLLKRIYEFFKPTFTSVQKFVANSSQTCLVKTKNKIEALKTPNKGENKVDLQIESLDVLAVADTQSQKTLKRLLSEQSVQTAAINAAFEATNPSTSSEKQSENSDKFDS